MLLSSAIRWTLDQYQLTGVFAGWRFSHQDDLRSLHYQGFAAVVDRWVVTRSDRAVRLPGQLPHERALSTLGDHLRSSVEKLLFAEQQALIDTYRSWSERYATSLADLEEEREAAAARLRARMEEAGYASPRLRVPHPRTADACRELLRSTVSCGTSARCRARSSAGWDDGAWRLSASDTTARAMSWPRTGRVQ